MPFEARESKFTWHCIVNKKEEPPKNFRNFQRGIKFEPCAVECFGADSGAEVKECGMFPLESDRRFGASLELNHELYNLISSALKQNSSLNKHERTDIKTTAQS